jgi:hypothetical protein
MLVDGKRFTSDGGLIDLEEGIFSDDSTIGWNNSSLLRIGGQLTRPDAKASHRTHLFELENITGNDHWSFDFGETTIT